MTTAQTKVCEPKHHLHTVGSTAPMPSYGYRYGLGGSHIHFSGMAQALSEVLMRLRLKTALDSDLQDSTPSAPTSPPLSGGRPSISFSPLTGSHIGTVHELLASQSL